MASRLEPTSRTALRRASTRGRFDTDTIHAILDEAYVAHVGFVVDGAPHVLPMAYGRVDDVLYLHGAAANAMLRALDDAPVCVTVTLLDGLVLARSAFHHSMNSRTVVLFGTATRVHDADEKRIAFDAIVDHAVPGRTAEARPPTDTEVRITSVVRVPITEGSAKVRSGGPNDEPGDLDLPVWAGQVPLRTTVGDPIQEDAQRGRGIAAPSPTRFVR
jgi:nitroimidazol reductase NimA-like FMN-containing flavoprotein (pyridoxamine 5'-phosphate oxidase superfamily)